MRVLYTLLRATGRNAQQVELAEKQAGKGFLVEPTEFGASSTADISDGSPTPMERRIRSVPTRIRWFEMDGEEEPLQDPYSLPMECFTDAFMIANNQQDIPLLRFLLLEHRLDPTFLTALEAEGPPTVLPVTRRMLYALRVLRGSYMPKALVRSIWTNLAKNGDLDAMKGVEELYGLDSVLPNLTLASMAVGKAGHVHVMNHLLHLSQAFDPANVVAVHATWMLYGALQNDNRLAADLLLKTGSFSKESVRRMMKHHGATMMFGMRELVNDFLLEQARNVHRPVKPSGADGL